MDDATLASRQHRSHRTFYRLLGEAPGHELLDLPGVQAAIVPGSPERSMPNAVLYDDADALFEAYPRLEEAYAAAGVRAWTVWTPPDEDEEVGRRLAALGHAADGVPPLMVAALSDLDLEPRRELDLDPAPSWDAVGRLNDAAYELTGAPLQTALRTIPPGAADVQIARVGGRPAASVVVLLCGEDAYVCFVAVDPRARGLGLSSELLRRGLARARERGATSTTLEASRMGGPIYAAMGYRSLGRLGMWERRVRNDSAQPG